MAEKFFWADQIADKIIKEKGNKKQYVCASAVTPSGNIHIGNFREVITTDLVVRALIDKGKKVRFIYTWDDYDRFRKVPKGINKNYEKYVGMSLSEFPSPFDKNKSYAEYFEKKFENSLKKVGIYPEFVQQYLKYSKGEYAKLIKIAIEKKQKIIEILNKYRKEPLEKKWIPLKVYCEKCKKDSTKILDIRDYEIEYKCDCGFKNKIDFRKKCNIKLNWRVDWPMKWVYEKVDFEPGGIDHSAAGGSFDTGKQIVKKVYDYNPPVYQFYEWIRIKGGGAFSSSKGNVITLDEVEEIYEPEVLRYLFAGTRPNKSFQISFDNDVIKIYEDFDLLEKKYYQRKANAQERRIYEMSRLNITKKKPEKVGFRHLITYIQLKKEKELSIESRKRAEKVKNWLKKYAGEDMKFVVTKKIKAKLNEKEKEALKELKKSLEKKDYTEKELFNEFYNICERIDIKNTDFFNAAYRILINKSKGPRLASLILITGKGKIIKLLKQIK
jgi:lysyl-tRNA synthetase, class I